MLFITPRSCHRSPCHCLEQLQESCPWCAGLSQIAVSLWGILYLDEGKRNLFFLVEKEGLYEDFNSENGTERIRCKLACSPTSHEEATLIWGHKQSACFFEQRTIPQGMVGFLGGFSTYSPGFFPYLPPAIRGHVEHLFFTESSCGLKNPLQ